MSIIDENEFVKSQILNLNKKFKKYKYSLEDEIDSIEREIASTSGKQDYSTSTRLNQDKKQLKNELRLVDNILDDYDSFKEVFYNNIDVNLIDYDKFMHFDNENYLEIEESSSEIFSSFTDGSNNVLSIGRTIKSPFNNSDIKDFVSKTYFQHEDNKNEEIYLSLFVMEFENYYAPLIFIPVNIENYYDYKILRNYNKDIKINPFLKDKLFQNKIESLEINNFSDFIKKLYEIDDVKIIDKVFFGTFDFSKTVVFDDLNSDVWDNFFMKLNIFINSDSILSNNEVIEINNNIANKWPKLGYEYESVGQLKDPVNLFKNLLANNQSILFVSDDKKSIENLLINSNLGSLILDFDLDMDLNSFIQKFDEKLLTKFNNINEDTIKNGIDNINKIKKFLKTPYLNYNLSPIEIYEKYEEYSKKINNPIDVPVENIEKYNAEDTHRQILAIIDKSKGIENFGELFNKKLFTKSDYDKINGELNALNEAISKFKDINLFLNKTVSIKLFDNPNEASFLYNFTSLNENYIYIHDEDIKYLNNFIFEFDDDLKVNSSIQDLNNFLSKLSDLNLKLNNFNENLKSTNEKFNDLNFINQNIQLIDEVISSIDNFNLDDLKVNKNSEAHLFNKYFSDSNDILANLEYHIAYTELVNNQIIEDEKLFNNNLSFAHKKIELLYQYYKFILKKLKIIVDFFKQRDYLSISYTLFDSNLSLDNLLYNIRNTQLKLYNIYSIGKNTYSELINSFINVFIKNKLSKDEISNLFYYTIYKSLYHKIISDCPILSEDNFREDVFNDKLDELNTNLWESQYNDFINCIFKHASEISPEEKNKFKEFNSIKDILKRFKEDIMMNKKLFMVDMQTVYECLDNSYEDAFDYVILGNMNEFNNLEVLSLMLRSKNRIIRL